MEKPSVHSGQHQVEQHKVIFPAQSLLKPRYAVVRYVGLEAVQLKIIALDLRNFLVVLNYKYPAHSFASFNITIIHNPPPTLLRDSTEPPICSAVFFTTASPSPLPSPLCSRAGSAR